MAWAEGTSQDGWNIDRGLAGADAAINNLETIKSRNLGLDPDVLFQRAAEIYRELGIQSPGVTWIGGDNGLSLVFCENKSRGVDSGKRSKVLIKTFMEDISDPGQLPEDEARYAQTSNKPYLAFKQGEFLGVLDGTNLAVCINASPMSDGHLQFVELPTEGETEVKWHNAAEYNVEKNIKPLVELSRRNGKRGFVGYISGVNTFAQFHMQAYPAEIGGCKLPMVDAVDRYLEGVEKFKSGFKQIPIADGVNLSCFMYSNPKLAMQKLAELSKLGYNCDMFTINGYVLLLPIDSSLPNVFDPSMGININEFLVNKKKSGEISQGVDISKRLKLATRGTVEKLGFMIKEKPSADEMATLGIDDKTLVRNYWNQVEQLFPRELIQDI